MEITGCSHLNPSGNGDLYAGALVGVGIPFFPIVLAATVLAYFAEFITIKLTLEDVTDVELVT